MTEEPNSAPKVTCWHCNGEGLVECECIECGNVHNRECPICFSEGETNIPAPVPDATAEEDIPW